ncbi:response regulator transcription factor [Cupriavidus basilensis]|uniref:Response regulator transcription factor n=1 Tax=Cupriavidus basilensis TaxID=68895 RepID=A0ABT6AZ26_9BURK|nr:response regulator transcription factor [Cupriavidus basilensis]MDF3837843.1 response regulator transcription factor [Cupriavidus basilensis]
MRLLLVDDDGDLCKMLTAYLSAEGFVTTAVSDGRAGVTAALSGNHDAVILDIMLPTLSGIDALREIRRRSDVPIIMLTARGDKLDRVVGLEMGADDYVPKPYDPRELVARVRAVLRRRPLNRAAALPEKFSILGLVLSPSTRTVFWSDRSIELTVSEFNVLEALMRADGAVKSKDDLSLEALGRRREPYDRSLDVHISNIRHKLLTKGARDIEIETVRGVGYRIKAE